MSLESLPFILLIVSAFLTILLLRYVLKQKPVTQIQRLLALMLICVIVIYVGLIFQRTFAKNLNIKPIYFENFIYIGTCFVPVMFFLMSTSFINTKIKFSRKYALLFIVPVISLIVLFTNNLHHLFYEEYSFNFNEMIYDQPVAFLFLHWLRKDFKFNSLEELKKQLQKDEAASLAYFNNSEEAYAFTSI